MSKEIRVLLIVIATVLSILAPIDGSFLVGAPAIFAFWFFTRNSIVS